MGRIPYTYDNAGNVTQQTQGASGPTWVYSYNNNNQLPGASYTATLGGTVTQMATYVTMRSATGSSRTSGTAARPR